MDDINVGENYFCLNGSDIEETSYGEEESPDVSENFTIRNDKVTVGDEKVSVVI